MTTSTSTEASAVKPVTIEEILDVMKAFVADLPPPVRKVGDAWLMEHHTGDMFEHSPQGFATGLKDGIPAPGLYFKDSAAYSAVVMDPRMRMYSKADVMDGSTCLNGITVRVATEAEWAWFEMQARK